MVTQNIDYVRMGLISLVISFLCTIIHFITANRNNILDIYESILIPIILVFGVMGLIFFVLNNEIKRRRD